MFEKKHCILIADDEQKMVRALTDLFTAKGYRVICAYDGEEALDKYLEHSTEVDLLLLDVMMPKLDGFEVLESNRGNIAKFTIENIPYIKGKKNFVKAHTCFNRLDIPMFQKKEELEEAIKFVSTREILGFGID